MEYKFYWVEKFHRQILLLSFIGLIVHHLVLLIVQGFSTENIIFFMAGAIMYFLSWGMVFVVLGFQKINPLCPKVVFKWFCYFFMFCGALSLALSLLNDLISPFSMKKLDESVIFSSSPTSAGLLISSFRLYKNTIIDDL